MTRKIGARLVSGLLVTLVAFSCTSWSALAGTNGPKKAAVTAHPSYYLYSPADHSAPSAPRAFSGGHELCWLPSDGCDNNHSITN
jgi:hypothetical protein